MSNIVSIKGGTVLPERSETPLYTVIICETCGSHHWVLQDTHSTDGMKAVCLHCGAYACTVGRMSLSCGLRKLSA